MLSMAGIVAAIAAILAVIVGALFIGVCLLVAWVTDAVRSAGGRPQRESYGEDSTRGRALAAAGRRRRHGSV